MRKINSDFMNEVQVIHEGFFSQIYLTDNYAYKVLKKDSNMNKKILEAELDLGLCFSPEIYKRVVPFESQPSTKYALQMLRVDGKTLTNLVKELRREDKEFVDSGKMGEILEKILSNLIKGYNKAKIIHSNHYLTEDFLKDYFKKILFLIKTNNVLKLLNVPLNLAKIEKKFVINLKTFIPLIEKKKFPVNHGDLITNNILISRNKRLIYLIDPYPELLNEVKFKHNILNPKGFSFFYDLACLKLSISSFQNFEKPFLLFDKTVNKFSFFQSIADTKNYMRLWEVIVALRQLIILYFNFEHKIIDAEALEKNLNFSLFQRYGIRLHNLEL